MLPETISGDGMSEKTLTRMDLSEAVFREVGLSRNESAQLVESGPSNSFTRDAHSRDVAMSSHAAIATDR